ncbi:MAG TPA: YggT family protein [Pyrinomonadaceae bacterium]|nr:YggT family protein [Pyrinomonadaceae bacterium]
MLIIDRIFEFFYMMVIAIIVVVVLLMILRLIANAADLNPFAWHARTIRRLTDGFIMPVRRSLVAFGVDPKFAPILVILIAILLGWFGLRLAGAIQMTSKGLLLSIQTAAPVLALGYILYGLVSIYILLILIRIIFSWGMVSYSNRIMRFLVDTTEPMLGPLRRMLPTLGPMDISPIVAYLILWLFQQAIAGTLLQGFS